ncbi:YncE family protein [Mycolicibacter minnesotensis]
MLLPACSSNPISLTPPTIAPAEPAVSPADTPRPAGTVRPLAGRATGAAFDTATGILAVLSPGPDAQAPATVGLVGAAGRPSTVLTLPGPASALAGDGRGAAYLAGHGGYFTVDLATNDIKRVDVEDSADTDFTAIARRGDGIVVLGSADGAVHTLTPEGTRTAERAKIFARVDEIVMQGDIAVVLDRGQTSVTTIGPDGKPQYALRAGQGATTLAADPHGPVLAADTRGGRLLVYGVDPLMLHQDYPVPHAPYGVAGAGGFAWVSQTASNTVVGYDLTTGIPVEKVRYPTVRQPNTLAFDNKSDTLYVVSGTGAGVQVIDHATRSR